MPKHLSYEKEKNIFPEVIPGAVSLLQHLDKRLYVWLRDGRMYVGKLRSVDQFANLLLYESFERVYFNNEYGDIPQGVLIIRGENVSLLGEMKEDQHWRYYAKEILAAVVQKEKKKLKINKLKTLAYWKRGLVFTAEDYF
ncbi:u6 snRNA-associated Sm-like protein LSm1 [Trichonephila inaurata madagascariensis]|uniref:U6 snRNA-associated Sm-like protein LSm1 n=1 Tax=Trichonephila inaurata madagascariensis TaxID=2747483 RepID=A0A8X7CPY3_9ARAC|nr:u6 snRNA-associated Sm-like protein LSm1 [Trichonephila inaurata madagascariensis]